METLQSLTFPLLPFFFSIRKDLIAAVMGGITERKTLKWMDERNWLEVFAVFGVRLGQRCQIYNTWIGPGSWVL